MTEVFVYLSVFTITQALQLRLAVSVRDSVEVFISKSLTITSLEVLLCEQEPQDPFIGHYTSRILSMLLRSGPETNHHPDGTLAEK